MAMPDPSTEIALIEAFADTRVIGLTINHENMSDAEIAAAITDWSEKLGLPVTDALSRPAAGLVGLVQEAFPDLCQKPGVAA